MMSWGVIVCLAAIAGIEVFAEEPLSFPEDARSARILSGWDAEEGQIPWQLSLRMVGPTGGVSSCGGSIIHPEWGMTAAHCTATRVTMVLRAGAVSLLRPELLFETTEYYNHPLYIDALQSVVQPHDIALLKFQRSITFSDRVQPVRLQSSLERNRNYDGVRLEASGWGRTWTNGATPENLQWVYLLGDSNLRCWQAFGGSSIIVDSTICASAYNVSSQSTCQGDSGGPLVELEEDGKYTMVGVTSFVSAAGCHADFPAGFIRPGHYHDWVTQVTGIDFDWVPEEPTTEAPTTTAAPDSSSESIESSESSESSSEESEEATTTEAATTEAATTEAATTEAGSSEESSSEESEEATTTEAATTEAATTEAASSEESSSEESEEATTTEAATTEAATTVAASSEESSSEESEEATTTEAATTEAATTVTASSEESSSEESEEATTTEAATTEAATTVAASSEEASSEESEEATTTEAATTEAATTVASSTEESSSEESEEATTTEAAECEEDEEEESRSIFSYFRGFPRF